jgi:hypothetical protein
MNTTEQNEQPRTAKLYNLSGTLVNDAQMKTNSNGKAYALAKIQGAKRTTTVKTYVKAGIAALEGLTAGSKVRLFGTYDQKNGARGQTFSAMGLSPEPEELSAAEALRILYGQPA